MNEELYNEKKAAKFIGVCRGTLKTLPIPRFEITVNNARRMQRIVRYKQSDLEGFIQQNTITPDKLVKL